MERLEWHKNDDVTGRKGFTRHYSDKEGSRSETTTSTRATTTMKATTSTTSTTATTMTTDDFDGEEKEKAA